MELHSPPPHATIETRATARFTFQVTVPESPRQAIELFTPEGERSWAEGWDPIYVNIHNTQQVGKNTVFTTDAHSVRRIWVIDQYDRSAGILRYTVFAPNQSVTRIEVRVSARLGGSVVRVRYDRTALSAGADAAVEHFSLHAHAMQGKWQNALDAIRR